MDVSGESLGHSPFAIVGVGASAGGFEAFRQLLGGLPDAHGMAFLFVQHLDPHHESQLSELLGKSTRMKVMEATHGLAVEPEHVYVIPPNANLTIAQGVLEITPRGESRTPHLPIDRLFHSLAREQQARAIGVVLSGTGSDGTIGLCAIKAVGGITMAQEQRSARQPGMPKSAIDSGCVDFVAPVDQIARRLVEIAAHPYHAPDVVSQDALAEPTDRLEGILRAVRLGTGVDFREYRDSTIRRRILRRMALHGDHSHEAYLARLGADRSEVDALYQDLLINVTSFFRDPEMFESLRLNVFPQIVRGRSARSPIRMWVAGCSTGQEAYSLAIALSEFLDTQPLRPPFQIFATDLSDPASLDRARAGFYPESIEAEMSAERLRRFFTREDHGYRIVKDIRDACVFARQNVTADPPFSHVQLISCRNVLIYMSAALQKRVLPIFHYALDAPGFLVLGSAESVGAHADLFEPVDRDHKIFAKKATVNRLPLDFGRREVDERRRSEAESALPVPAADLQREVDRLMLSRYAPAGALVDESFEIVQYRGHTSPYLEAPPGEPTTNVIRMAREGLLPELRSALIEAKTRKEPTRRRGVRVRGEERFREVDLLVLPVQPPDARPCCFLILFEEAPLGQAESGPQRASGRRRGGLLRRLTGMLRPGPDAGSAPDDHDLGVLRQELTATREYLESLLQQQDAANEELRSANEEVQSSNEELQSTNEELETTKEELQSANEELSTVNEQLQSRNAELNLVNDDLTNLQNSTTIPIVVLGSDLRIRRFTTPAKRVLKLLPSDLGRPISDLAVATAIPDLEGLVTHVLETVQPVEREILDGAGHWHGLRIHPYRTSDNRIDGAVIAFVDLDAVKSREKAIREARDYAVSIIETVHEPLIVLDAGLRVRTASRSFYETFGLTPSEAEGRLFFELQKHEWDVPELRTLLDHLLPERGEIRDFEVTREFQHLGSRSMLLNARLLPGPGEERILLTIRDVTASRRAEDALRAVDRRKDEFLATLAHELRNPLGAMLNSVEFMKRAGGETEPVAGARERLERSLRLTMRLVDDLLDISRIAENKLQLQVERISLATAVEMAVQNTHAQASARGHDLRVTLPPEPLWLDADPVRLAQVIGNLLSNAVRFTPAGGRIELGARREAATQRIELSVRDNGAGIAPDQIGQIFGMFHQGIPSSGGTGTGLGVGLALAKQLVELHDGTIEARSAGTGKGSEFIVRLPAAGPPPRALEAPEKRRAAAPPRRILLVDDNTDHAESLRLLFERLGHTVRVVHDGSSAVAAALEFAPDVALVDIGLPDIDGYEVARRLQRQPRLRQLKLIAQTGWGRDEDRRRSAEAGFAHHLVKPVEIDELEGLLAPPDAAG